MTIDRGISQVIYLLSRVLINFFQNTKLKFNNFLFRFGLKMADDERRTQISAANLRIPSYGILEPAGTDCYAINSNNMDGIPNSAMEMDRTESNGVGMARNRSGNSVSAG